MTNSLKVWRSSLLEEEQQKRRSSEPGVHDSFLPGKGSPTKVFTYETNEFYIPFKANIWFLPYFCSNFIEDNLEGFSGETLSKYYTKEEYENLLRRLRDKIKVPRMLQDLVTIIMIGLLLFLGATLLQFLLNLNGSSLTEEEKKHTLYWIWFYGLSAEVGLFVLLAVLREIVKCNIDSELAEENKYSGITLSLTWQREGKFLKLKIVRNNVEEGGSSQIGSKLSNVTEPGDRRSQEVFYKLA